MSFLSPKRALFAVLATALFASSAFAVNPSPRSHTRFAWDADAGELILFGGSSAFDGGTGRSYDSDETWAWTGARWVQRYPAHVAPARSAHQMVWDSTRNRIVMFGGRQTLGTVDFQIRALGDTWVYDSRDWRELQPPNSPTPRHTPAMAYDAIRDRVILYGGVSVREDGISAESIFDTWEFDGTTWTQAGDATVKLFRPILAYDAARNEVILLGTDADAKIKMYRRDPSSASGWSEVTPEKLPDCVTDSVMTYEEHTRRVLLTGGACPTSDTTDKTWHWNGTTWAEVPNVAFARAVASAFSYDPHRQTAVLYGGFNMFETNPRSNTMLFSNNAWRFAVLNTRPSPREQFAFTTDPVNQTIWLFGGLNEYSSGYSTDNWGFRGGQFFNKPMKDQPTNCDAPMSAWDSERKKLILVCWPTTTLEVEVFEFDGAEFKAITTTRNKPRARRFGQIAYDETLKKIVLFGGYDLQNFRDDTWTWDGSNWTEVKNNKPDNRALHAMWYDPLQKRVLLYGGVGRDSIEERVERFSDMWAFTGNGWTKLTVANHPGARLGPQVAINPETGKLLLFGGVKVEQTDPQNEATRRQFYDNETWEWDGGSSSWTRLSPASSPAPRENGRIAYDPHSKRLVLFGGYSGFFYSDVWSWTGTNWQLHSEPSTGGGRRRAAGS